MRMEEGIIEAGWREEAKEEGLLKLPCENYEDPDG